MKTNNPRRETYDLLIEVVNTLADNQEILNKVIMKGGFLLSDILAKSTINNTDINFRTTVDIDLDYKEDIELETIAEGIDSYLTSITIRELPLERNLQNKANRRPDRISYDVGDHNFHIDIGATLDPKLHSKYQLFNPKLNGLEINAYKIETILTDKIHAHSHKNQIGFRFKDEIDLFFIATQYSLSEIRLLDVLEAKEIKGRVFGDFKADITLESRERPLEAMADVRIGEDPIIMVEILKRFIRPFKDGSKEDIVWSKDILDWEERT